MASRSIEHPLGLEWLYNYLLLVMHTISALNLDVRTDDARDSHWIGFLGLSINRVSPASAIVR